MNMLRDKGHDFLEQEGAGSYPGAILKANATSIAAPRAAHSTWAGGTRPLSRRFKKAIYETDQGNFVMPSQEKALLARRIVRVHARATSTACCSA
ncbi:MAG: hypothetical protein MZU91_13450 [Desulfosudis oleivorans]|nr:hypothetical protein [Desulfosudis oleivorans]